MNHPDPWETFGAKHHRGERITSSISRIVPDIGLFINLDGEVFGIVHLGDLDWATSGEMAISRYKLDQSIEAVILSIDPERQRVSLGIKQLGGSDPRQDRHGDSPTPVPMRPNRPKQPSSQSAANRRMQMASNKVMQ